ncbi:MAG TPA: hypothetical protein VH592_01085 [Gemmataceae bacterium]|jgi:transcriptional regulator GlxA family with amidase domain
MPTTRNLAILIFDDVEVLDFCGPFEVFSVANRFTEPPAFHVFTLAEKKATAQFLAGISTRHGPQPAVYPNTTEVHYVAALKKADVDALMVRLENEIDQLQDRLDQFNHAHRIEVDGRTLELAS